MTRASRRDRWPKLAALPLAEKLALVEASACLPIAWVGLRTVGLRASRDFVWRSGVRERAMDAREVQRLGQLVAIAGRHGPFPATCLPQALVLGWMLRRRGVASELRVGVRLERGVLHGHAWVESAGEPVNEDANVREQFATFGGDPTVDAKVSFE